MNINYCAGVIVKCSEWIKLNQETHTSAIVSKGTKSPLAVDNVKRLLPKHYSPQSNSDLNTFANNYNHKVDEKNVDRRVGIS